jgi:hypothetical protein
VSSIDFIEMGRAASDRRKGPLPESEWNHSGLWKRAGDSPATYIPAGYALNASRNEKSGTWFVDKRDGKRLFVPNTPVNGISQGVIKGEAIKVTNWPVREVRRTVPGLMSTGFR